MVVTRGRFKVGHEARAKTVENIWIITESLNILYRENWTRLAAQEIARFQDQLVKRITEDMIAAQNGGTYVGSSDPVTERRVPEYEWNFAKAFLYSLTVLTTIGKCPRCFYQRVVYIARVYNFARTKFYGFRSLASS